MQTQVDELVTGLKGRRDNRKTERTKRRILVGLCGIPGSGKSQLGLHVVNELNKGSNEGKEEPAILVGMDGWHLTRKELSQMKDPKLAFDKRGAPWTFNDEEFAKFAESLQSTTEHIFAPSFSHSKKDPIEKDVRIEPHHQFVIIEGLYCNAKSGAWRRAATIFDERWVIECDESIAKKRLISRHVTTGVAKDESEAEWRIEENDLPNGRWLLDNLLEPVKRIKSLDDSNWQGKE